MLGFRVFLLSLFGLLVALASLFPASVPAATDPENLRSLAPALESDLKEWLVAWRAVQPGLRVDQFKKLETHEIRGPWGPMTVDLSQGNPKLPLYIFSPDGRWLVDPFGSLHLMSQNGLIRGGFDVDSYVYLMDRETLRKRQILVCGTSCGYHEAVWLSNDAFVVAGYDEVQPREGCVGGYTQAPQLFLVSLKRNYVTRYAGPVSCRGVRSEYIIQRVKQKIPNVKF